ncbi:MULTISPECIES: Crp/Fnr family transcriptional regulator [Arenibacter]|uniref:Cyclic nucleotide-binding domain protein n=1 Tax=Arenibacter algicola TaxID=616991 RepID=A0A221V0V8_9FLAO|nr:MULTISPECIES: Crp/Fnr family transcriptional regulator [Arenibacter]ASO07212.1 cyclic nucleotide-binding domain protein [Arenibacter algicola]GBF20715.1 cyclic nucleotide-binding domain protein [Arenibacter sp. NBRC 103722]|tara:strand:- start:26355 stop:26924 length:570 start_codon:yes stop_codon:yes gene_type:complete
MYDNISPIINSVSPISSKSIAKIQEIAEYHEVKKGELITTVGQNNNLEYFITEGICKSFLYTPEGEDVTISFFMSGSIISPSTTRNKEGRSILNIRALTDMEMATINAGEFEKLMVEDLEIRHFGNTVLRNELMGKVQKEIALASLKGKDRLQLLRDNFPNIENLIPHSDIASYLGLTTISLSRLRTQS